MLVGTRKGPSFEGSAMRLYGPFRSRGIKLENMKEDRRGSAGPGTRQNQHFTEYGGGR